LPDEARTFIESASVEGSTPGSSLFGVLRSSAFELSAAPVFNVIRGASLLFGFGCLALPSMGSVE
jgi:hypothetical protein